MEHLPNPYLEFRKTFLQPLNLWQSQTAALALSLLLRSGCDYGTPQHGAS